MLTNHKERAARQKSAIPNEAYLLLVGSITVFKFL